MNKTKAQQIIEEFNRRKALNNFSILDSCFEEQKKFIQDPSKRKAALCSRRAAKSFSAAIMLMDACINNPNVANCYIGLTKETAKNVLLPHIKKLRSKFKIKCRIYKSPTSVVFDNGASILFFGIDDSESEREKLLGQAFKVAVIDECASITIDLKATIQEYISPTLLDHEGQLVLIGTPGNLRNYFCDVTTGLVPGWSNHYWTADRNPYVAKQYLEEIKELKEMYPNIEEDSGYQQHYLGKWTIDQEKKLYKYTNHNLIQELPPGNYNYILSLDLGWNDDNAFVIGAYKEYDNTLYIVHVHKQPKMIVDAINQKITELEKLYPFNRIVIDSANKQFVQELTYRTGRVFSPAAKTEKLNYIHLMNSDFVCNKIKIVEPNCKKLIEEYNVLTILDDTTSNYQVAIGNQMDHASDSALYCWRESYNYTNKPEEPKIIPNSEQAVDRFWEQEAEKLNKRKHMNYLESDWE